MCWRCPAITTPWSASRTSAAWPKGLERAWKRLLPTRLPIHLLAQTLRSHVGPDFFDVGQALRLRAGLARVPPARRVLFLQRPDGVLFLVVDHDPVEVLVLVVGVHAALLAAMLP